MAMQIALVVKDGLATDLKSLSLLANAAGFALKRNGYQPGMALDGVVSDVLTVDVIGSSHNDLATKLQTLEEYFQRARWANESPERYEVWLRVQMTNESIARQALILGGSHGDRAGFYSPPASPGNRLIDYPLVIDRLPIWEDVTQATYEPSSHSSVGGKAEVSCAGDVPARIKISRLYGTGAVALTEYWWGFRSPRFGTVANFVSPWECESGTLGTDTAVITDDSSASNNSRIGTTFETVTAMTTRLTLSSYQISPTYYEDLRGTFNIIARMKMSANSARVRLSSGFTGAWSYNDPVVIIGSSWKFYDLGRITLPAGGKAAYSPMRNSTIQLEVERVGASGIFSADCFVPIPVNEGCAHISGGTGVQNELMIGAAGHITCFDYTGSYINGLASSGGTNAKDYTLPLGTGIVVTAAQRAAGSTLADAVTMKFYYHARYRTLKGNA